MTLCLDDPVSTPLDDDPPIGEEPSDDTPTNAPLSPAAHELRTEMTAARLRFTWPGLHKTLTTAQKRRAADSFGARGESVSARKKLFDTQHPALRAVIAVRGRATQYWRGSSLPYPEPGLRLIRRDQLPEFDARLRQFATELEEAVAELDHRTDELRQSARERLGDLFDPADYPASVRELFALRHDFPAVEPPAYLLQLEPALYERESARLRSRFEEAVELAETAFTTELAGLVDHLTERLTGTHNAKPKVFRDSSIGNLEAFCERFARLSVRSSAQLDELVETTRGLLRGVAPERLRESPPLRRHVSERMGEVRTALDALLVDRPRRRLERG